MICLCMKWKRFSKREKPGEEQEHQAGISFTLLTTIQTIWVGNKQKVRFSPHNPNYWCDKHASNQLLSPKQCVRSVCWEALQGVASAVAVFYTFIWFPLNENKAATSHTATPPFRKQHLLTFAIYTGFKMMILDLLWGIISITFQGSPTWI